MSTPGAARAHAAVLAAMKDGRLPRITPGARCADCGQQAEAYDHRDYNKPLEVEAVCHACNCKRGPAIPDEDTGRQERHQIYLPEPMKAALRLLKIRTGKSAAWHTRRAIVEYLKTFK